MRLQTTEHAWLKVIGIASTLIPVGGALIGLGIYVGNLTNQIEASRSEVQVLKGQVSQLQDILQKTQTASASGRGATGPEGPKGETGDVGPKGPQGDRGPPGVAPTSEELAKLISEALASRNLSAPTVGQGPASAPSDNDCMSNMAFADMPSFSLRAGIEVCDATGKILGIVNKITVSGFTDYIGVSFTVPGEKGSFCWKEATDCRVPWLPGRKFYIERLTSGVDGNIAVMRLRG